MKCLTGFAWLQQNDPTYKETQPSQREVLMSPGALAEVVGSSGIRKEYGVHRQTWEDDNEAYLLSY
jgi:hypothetical protein